MTGRIRPDRLFLLVPKFRLCRGQSGNRHAEGGATDVVEPHSVAEVDGRGVATVLAADSTLQILTSRPSFFDAHLHQLAHAGCVERLEWIVVEDFLLEVVRQERVDVISAVTRMSFASGRLCRS